MWSSRLNRSGLQATIPSSFRQTNIHKKDAALLSFSSSLGISKATSKAQARRSSRCTKTSGRISQGWDHVSESFSPIFGKEAIEKLCLAFSCCLERHVNDC